MVTPKPPASSPERSPVVVLAVKILLVVTILFLLPDLVHGAKRSNNKKQKKNKRLDKIYLERVLRCETGATCGDLILEESMNCVSECVSPACRAEAKFDVDPLEEGEVDEDRALVFSLCVKKEIQDASKVARAASLAARGR